jgi:hypothetical protein
MDIDEVSSDSTSNFSKAKAQAGSTLQVWYIHAFRTHSSVPHCRQSPFVCSHACILQPWAMCALALIIGIVSGLVGVGGGEFLVPMFLSVGFQHQKSSATSSCLIALATACDAINYLRSRELQVRASSRGIRD